MAQPTDAEIAAALAATSYVYTDPVIDPEGSDIIALDPTDPPDRFPPESECRA